MTRIAVVLAAIIIGVVAVGAVLLVYDDLSAPPIVITDPDPARPIAVEIVGAIATPGVYELPAEARVIDLVDAAGGTTADADLGGINLARRVRDEDQVVIPSRTLPPATSAFPDGVEPGSSTAAGQTARININTASVDELDRLPGIGPAIAQRVVEYRAEQGPFRTVDELARVSGISSAMVDELRPEISVSE
jgi:competence protein ComEA